MQELVLNAELDAFAQPYAHGLSTTALLIGIPIAQPTMMLENISMDEDAYQADNTQGWEFSSYSTSTSPPPLIYNKSEYIISAWHFNQYGTSAICLKMS